MKYCIALILLICCNSCAQTKKDTTLEFNTEWSKNWGGLSDERVMAAAEDSQGNIFAVGHFEGSFQFLKDEVRNTEFTFGKNDIFLFKLSAKGEILLSVHLGGSSYDLVSDIAIDHNDNIYLAGYFRETIDLYPGEKIDLHSSNGHSDAFLLKLDNEANYLWAKSWGSDEYDMVESIAIDEKNNVLVLGAFNKTFSITDESKFELISQGKNDIFFSKFNANGDEIWSKCFGGKGDEYASQLIIGSKGEILIAGSFKDEINLDSGKIAKSRGSEDGFLIKINESNGDILDFGVLGGLSEDWIEAIDTDSEGNIYLTGYFLSNCDVAVLSEEVQFLENDSSHDGFVVKLNNNFQFLWVKEIKGTDHNRATDLLIMNDNTVVVGGRFKGMIEASEADKPLNSKGGMDVFLLFLDKDGEVKDFRSIGGKGYDQISLIAPIGSEFLIGGEFEVDLSSIETPKNQSLLSNGDFDAFIQKISVKN